MLPVLRNTITGLNGVDLALLDMPQRQRRVGLSQQRVRPLRLAELERLVWPGSGRWAQVAF